MPAGDWDLSSFFASPASAAYRDFRAALGRDADALFRLGLSVDNIQRWDLTYDDPYQAAQVDPTTGELLEDKVTTAEKALWHIVPSAEVLFGQNFMLRFGYNYRRRQELNLAEKPGLTGMSLGIGVKVSKLHLSYAFAQFYPGSASNTISLAVRFADFKKAPAGS